MNVGSSTYPSIYASPPGSLPAGYATPVSISEWGLTDNATSPTGALDLANLTQTVYLLSSGTDGWNNPCTLAEGSTGVSITNGTWGGPTWLYDADGLASNLYTGSLSSSASVSRTCMWWAL